VLESLRHFDPNIEGGFQFVGLVPVVQRIEGQPLQLAEFG
jgi:hypothetical protein